MTGTDDKDRPAPAVRSDLRRDHMAERVAAEAANQSVLDNVRLRRGQVATHGKNRTRTAGLRCYLPQGLATAEEPALPATCSVADLCTLLIDLTPRRVEQLANEGVLVKADAGRYDLVRSVRGYIAYIEYILAKDRQGTAANGEAAADREAAARRLWQTVP
jgi:hypothetical protein